MFVHLHGHSTYSLLEAIGDVGDVVKRASKLGQHAVAVTDYNGMYGAGYFYKKTKGSDVKPLIGVELPFVYDLGSFDRQLKKQTWGYITFLAKNYEGYQQLLRLVSAAHMDDRQELPFVDMALLADLSEVYVFFGGQYSWFAAMVQAKAPEDKIMSTVDVLIERFGKENVLGEIVAQNYSVIPHMQGINMMMQNVIDTYELQSFVSGNFHYVDQSHADAFEVALAIKDGVKIYDESRRKVIGDYHMMSESEIRHQLTQNGYMPDRINDLIETTSYIADRIDISIPLGATLFPLYEVPDDVAGLYEKYKDGLIEE